MLGRERRFDPGSARANRGSSLPEVIVALAVVSILLTGLLVFQGRLFHSQNQNWQLQQQLWSEREQL